MTGARTTVVAIVATTVGNIPVWLVAGLAPQVGADLGFGDVGLGAAIAGYFGISAVASLSAGRLVERIGWRHGVALSAALASVALLGIAVLAASWPLLMLFLAVGAFAFTISQPAANVAVAQAVVLARQGTAFGIKQAALPLTTLLVGVAVPVFTGSPGWRWAFIAAAGVALVFLSAVLVGTSRERRRPPDRGAPAAGTGSTQAGPKVRPRPALVVLAAGAGLGSAATGSLGGFLVTYAVASGLTVTLAGHLLAIGSIVSLVSRLVTGFLADRRGRRHLLVVSLMMLCGSAGFALLAVDGRPWLILAGTLLAFGLGWSWNGLFAFAVVLNHKEYPAVATGVAQTAISTGAAAGPLAFGVVVALLGYSFAWVAASVALAGGAALVALGRRMIARSAKPPS